MIIVFDVNIYTLLQAVRKIPSAARKIQVSIIKGTEKSAFGSVTAECAEKVVFII